MRQIRPPSRTRQPAPSALDGREIAGDDDNGRAADRAERLAATRLVHLQSQLGKLRGEKDALDARLAKAQADGRRLAAESASTGQQIEHWRKAAMHSRHREFWALYQRLAAVHDDAESYAETVNFDPTRILATSLLGELRALGVSPDVAAHAQQIVDLFDPHYYQWGQTDLTAAGGNPLLHYVTRGHIEGRQPNPLFDPAFYRAQTGPVNGDPLLDYVRRGTSQTTKPHPLFDPQYYLERNPAAREAGINPLFHYQLWGARQGYDPSPLFAGEYYLGQLGEAPLLSDNPLHDYLLLGWEAPDPHPLFSNRYVAAQLARPLPAQTPLVAYETDPDLWRELRPHPLFDLDYLEGVLRIEFPRDASPLHYYCRLLGQYDVDPSVLFDSALYRHQVETAGQGTLSDPPIIDYLKRGYKNKKLRPNIIFDPEAYIRRNPVEVTGPELVHYCLVGDRRGYYCHELFSAGIYNALRTDDSALTALEHFLLAGRGQAVESHPHIARPLDRRVIDFVLDAIREPAEFDAAFYRDIYADMRGLDEAEARDHFNRFGRVEGRWGSPTQLVRSVRIEDMPLGFFPDEYLALNPDLQYQFATAEFLPLLHHYLTTGRLENRRVGRWQFHLDRPAIDAPTLDVPAPAKTDTRLVDVCVLIHIFYTDLWPELAGFANSFSDMSRDVFINIVDASWSPRLHAEVRELCPDAFVQLSNDDGRDIGGFIRLLDNIDIERYTAFALMHTKKSPHIPIERGAHWRRTLLNAFAGSREVAADAVALMSSDPAIGMIASKEWRATDLGNNAEHYRRLLDHFQISGAHRQIEYVSGTMFLIRPEIIRRLYNGLKEMDFEYGGDKGLEFHHDGQIAHAVERLIGNLTRQMGYRIHWI